jgi:hypothetical protein
VIILLCRDDDDAERYCTHVHTAGGPVLAVYRPEHLETATILPGARIHRTEFASCGQALVSALQRIAARVPIVDPTGLLGPILHSPGARTREPWGTPPVGAIMTGTRSGSTKRTADHRNLGTPL